MADSSGLAKRTKGLLAPRAYDGRPFDPCEPASRIDNHAEMQAFVDQVDLSRFPAPLRVRLVEMGGDGAQEPGEPTRWTNFRVRLTTKHVHTGETISVEGSGSIDYPTTGYMVLMRLRAALVDLLSHELDECTWFAGRQLRDPHEKDPMAEDRAA